MRKRTSVTRILSLIVFSLLMLSFSAFADDDVKVAADPVRIGVGARTLGMGKMGLALADDCNAIFLNPAGLGYLEDWQIMSMTGQFISEINYLQFGGAYRTDFGTFGLGYVGASIGADFPTPLLVSFEGEYRVIASSTEGQSFAYNDAVFLLTYGTRLRDLVDWGWAQNLAVGANVRVFTLGLSGTDIHGGTGSGFDMDIGLLYQPLPWLNTGITGQNILPADMGGKITWATGQEEIIPALWKLGVSATPIGEIGPYQLGGHELIVGLDADLAPEQYNVPALMHLGVEWWPIQYVALRTGVDQDYVGTGGGALETTNNFTAGVGLLYSGFRFDYAYHQYNDIPENDTHYFSLSYNIWKEKPEAPPESFIKISQPADKTISYANKITVMGQVVEDDVGSVIVNGVAVEVTPSGAFALEVPLAPGKNSLNISAFAEGGRKLQTEKVRVLKLLSFRDVPSTYWARDVIEEIATIGIVTGYPNGTFRPDGPITRAEVTTLLVRALGQELPTVTEDVFVDLPASHWAAKYVKEGVEKKLVLGYPDGTFRPSNNINKAEGVVLMARFGELEEPDKVLEAPFPDLPGRHWAAPLVTAAKQAGFLKYLEGRDFEPKAPLTRAEAVEILSKTKFAKGKISDLMDFETGY